MVACPAGEEILLFSKMSRPAPRPTYSLFSGYGAYSLGIKWPGIEADHSLPSSIKVKNELSYISTPPRAFMARRGRLTL